MKAIRVHQYGGTDQLRYEDVPAPQPGAGEVLVRAYAAGVNPVDAMVRRGDLHTLIPYPMPYIPGYEVSGTVEALGQGVTDFQPGQAVFGLVRFPGPGQTYAEEVVVPAEQLARMPSSLGFDEAAGLPLTGLTAWQALFEAADLQPGQTVLVHAAAGGVGHLAVQFARAHGARVIGTASARRADLLRDLGLDLLVDYTQHPFEAQVVGVDVVLDTVGGDTRERSWGVLRRGGVLVSVAHPHPDAATAARHGVRAVGVDVRPDGALLQQVADFFDRTRARLVLEERFALAEAAQAQARSESGHVQGKVVLHIRSGERMAELGYTAQ